MTTKAEKSLNLLADFAPSTPEAWREAAEKLLKGRPFDKVMLTRTYDNLTLQPIYHLETPSDTLEEYPGFFPYTRGSKASGNSGNGWDIVQMPVAGNPAQINASLIDGLKNGQNTIALNLGSVNVDDWDKKNWAALFKDIDWPNYAFFLDCPTQAVTVAAALERLAKKQKVALRNLKGLIGNDPCYHLLTHGRTIRPLSTLYKETAQLMRWSLEKAPALQVLRVHGEHYHNAGGSVVQELGFTASAAVSHLRALLDLGLEKDEIAPRMRFSFALGGDFFTQIAKLRAARRIWAQIVAAFDGDENSQQMHIHARTGFWNKTVADPYVNMLRTTTEAFSAVVGGCNSLQVDAFDELFREPDALSQRIARNLHTILKTEAHLDKVIDPAGGSAFVEKLTDDLAKEAWKLFQAVEEQGGFFDALETGFIQNAVAAIAAEKKQNLGKRKDLLIGSNIYPNPNETLPRIEKSNLAKTDSGAKNKDDYLVADPLPLERGAAMFEVLRYKMADWEKKNGTALTAYLANAGPLKQHKARADFSAGFLQVAGIKTVYPVGENDPVQLAKAALESQAAVVVLCSADENYPEIVPAFMAHFRAASSKAMVLLAGYPKASVEEFRSQGVDDFIHIRANVYDVLTGILKRTGVM